MVINQRILAVLLLAVINIFTSKLYSYELRNVTMPIIENTIVNGVPLEEVLATSAKVGCLTKSGIPDVNCNLTTIINWNSPTKKATKEKNISSLEIVSGPSFQEKSIYVDFPVKVIPNARYLITGWLKISNRNCYLQNDPAQMWMGGSYKIQRGIFCGSIILEARGKTFQESNGDMVYRAANLLNHQIADFYYIANRNTDWFPFESELTIRPDESLITLRLLLNGPNMTLNLDQLKMLRIDEKARYLVTDAKPISSNLWIDSTPVNINGLIELNTAKHRFYIGKTCTSDDLTICKDTIRVLSRQDQRTLGTVTFDNPVFADLNDTKPAIQCTDHPIYRDKKQQCSLTWNKINLVLFEDDNLLFSLDQPTDFTVSGNPDRMNNTNKFYSSFDLGIMFESSLETNKPGGILFEPQVDRFATSMLGMRKIFTHRLQSINNNTDIADGKFVFNSERYLKLNVKNNTFKVLHAPNENKPLTVHYSASRGDTYLLSAFPQLDNNKLVNQPFWPIAHLPTTCDPLSDEINSPCLNKLNELKNQDQVKTLFFSHQVYASAINNPVYYLKSLDNQANNQILAPNQLTPPIPVKNVPLCNTTTTDKTDKSKINACRQLITNAFDLGGPWLPAPTKEQNLRKFIASIHNLGFYAIPYTSPQFYFYGLENYLNNIKYLHEIIGFDGIYADGTPSEGDMLNSIYGVRRMRQAMGPNGLIFFHLTTGDFPIDRNLRPIHLEPYANLIIVGESATSSWDLESYIAGQKTLNTCPPVWGLLYAGRLASGVPYALLPEIRPMNYAKIGDFYNGTPGRTIPKWTINPARQVEAQALCGGDIATLGLENDALVFTDSASPATIILAPGIPTKDECGYWARIKNSLNSKSGFCDNIYRATY